MLRPLALAVLSVAVAACGSDRETAGPGAVRVVATTTQVADFARNVAGARATVQQLLSPNTDPHEYEVRPGDVKALVHADLVLSSGGDADAWLGDALSAAGVDAADVVETGRAGGFEGDDPHWWQDPARVEKAVGAIRDALIRADGAGAAGYRANAARYVARLRRLDAGVRACMARVPANQRLLVTSHDALGYYARRYGVRVVGAVIPALTTTAQPSAGDVAGLVHTIERTGVRTIFAESSVNPKVEEAIARQTGARIGAGLWADSLGPSGTSGATYIGSIEANTRALVDGFTSGAVSCHIDA
jgi:ABC-type Zn uptake system ZnuABC Zn-binding protein ZnuA